MHGQRRSEYKSRLLNPETSSKLATKALQWNHLSHELLTQRRRLLGPTPPSTSAAYAAADDDNDDAKPSPEILLTLTEKMLSVNPDPSHLWNIRRELLLYVVPKVDEDTGIVSELNRPSVSIIPNIDIQSELKLTAHCLQRNPKAYSAWHREYEYNVLTFRLVCAAHETLNVIDVHYIRS